MDHRIPRDATGLEKHWRNNLLRLHHCFPYDTHERVMRDIEIIKRELPVDLMESSVLSRSQDQKTIRFFSRTQFHESGHEQLRLEHVSPPIHSVGRGGSSTYRQHGTPSTPSITWRPSCAGLLLRHQAGQGHETCPVFLRYRRSRVSIPCKAD